MITEFMTLTIAASNASRLPAVSVSPHGSAACRIISRSIGTGCSPHAMMFS